MSLRGRQSPIGAALFRLKTTGVYGPDQQRVLKRHASQLALSLEDIQVQDRSRRGEAEKLALELIAEIVASKAPTARIYRRFARQIKQLLEYRRLSIYLTDFGADLLTCVYQAGQGVAGSQTAKSHRLTRTWCGLAVSGGHSYVLEDRSLGDSNDWPELSTGTNLRSVLVAPIEYAGQVMGAVVLEDRHPGAYGPAAQQLLAKAASLLGPAFAKAPPVLGAKLVNPEAALELQASSRKDFPADLAHALRTPLAAIKGYSSALLQTDVIWPEELVKEFLETIDRETDRLSQVVGELVASADEAAGGD
ncbi:MAG: GAF domain-containing protein [Chloroflexi bacterium]|nr:GAF domain-containing protein [Chloroflexota bacterium]